MNHIESLSIYVTHFVDGLVRSGLKDVVISPGSRSTPLAMTFSEHEQINKWMIIDERSAAFYALGIAKKTNKPVALVCTSGTAAANYYPAIVEAHHSRVPLIVLTTDRPHELRDVGAPQAIDQIHMFQSEVKWFHEMALPEGTLEMRSYVRQKAIRAMHLAQTGNPGPVHLNFPFREPLVPDFTLNGLWTDERTEHISHAPLEGKKMISDEQLEMVVQAIHGKKRGVIVCGPQIDPSFAHSITQFASAWGLPILADPLSQIRQGTHAKEHVIDGYDAILRSKSVREALRPDFIIRFGAMPVSKPYLFYVQEHADIHQFVIENNEGYRDPTNNLSHFIYADQRAVAEQFAHVQEEQSADQNWLKQWNQLNDIAGKHVDVEEEHDVTEGSVVRSIHKHIPEDTVLFAGNSMAIRDVDTFFTETKKNVSLLANRGVNGIDGVVSSALGAATTGKRVTLLIGDLSFYHDMNGLLAATHYNLNVTIVLVNNNGGGIFSFLPQADDPTHFESLFGTPSHLDFSHAAKMYGGTYVLPKTNESFSDALKDSYNRPGLTIIEVQTERRENTDWHLNIWGAIEQDISEVLH